MTVWHLCICSAQINDCLASFLPAGARVRSQPFPDPSDLPESAVRVKKEYCQAMCRALVEESEGTDQFQQLVDSHHPKVAAPKEDQNKIALHKLINKIGSWGVWEQGGGRGKKEREGTH